ncbi:integral membrane pth11 [Penicillium digitatum]|uniref:Integral membrane pth11 n=1 Tax=Penicillium digitatum TaxID=36651 RepID=A0A7T7BME8_PENDI|nr:integral membrane pth11 [Penicillium digitatum]
MEATGDFGPAPSGIDLAENQQTQMLSAVITLMIVGTVAVLWRMGIRTKTSPTNFGLDDFLICAALWFAYGTGICVIISIKYKNGWHQQALTDSEFVSLWKLLFAHVFIYSTTVTLTKSSITLFYRRIFNLRWSFYFAIVIILAYFVAVVVTFAAACRPTSYFWEQYLSPTAEGACIDVPQFFLVNGIAAVVIDIIILIVPAPVIWKLQMPKSQRVAVTSILLLGGGVCIAGIVRVVFLYKNTHSNDQSWTIAPVFMWSCVEPFIGIVCACLPTFLPMFRRWWAILGIRKGSNKQEDYYGAVGSQTRRSRQHMSEDEEDGPHGDEVQLTSFPGWPLNFLRGKGSRDDVRLSRSKIQIKDEVTISYSIERAVTLSPQF